MPFTPPTLVASVATTGYESTFSFGSPLTAVLEIKSIKMGGYSIPEVNVTHLLSPGATEELRGGLLKPGMVEISGNFVGDATQLSITTMAANNAAQNPPTFAWQIKAPVQNGTKTYTCTGTGFIAKYDNGPYETNKAIEYTFSVQITGIISESVV